MSNVRPKEERILFKFHPHWWSYSGAFFIWLIVSLLSIPVSVSDSFLAGFIFMIFGFIPILWKRLVNRGSACVLTDRRILIERGFFSKEQLHANLSDIRRLDLHQSLFQKIVDTGDLSLQFDQGHIVRIESVVQPKIFTDTLRSLIRL